jgi:hypothetical protein
MITLSCFPTVSGFLSAQVRVITLADPQVNESTLIPRGDGVEGERDGSEVFATGDSNETVV